METPPTVDAEKVGNEDTPIGFGLAEKPANPLSTALALAAPAEVAPAAPAATPSKYAGASLLELSESQKRLLLADVDADDVEILPTGEVYLSQVRYRDILNEVFGPGGWALLPLGPPTREATYVCQEWGLYADGNFVSSAWGEQDFQMGSHKMSYPMALEGAKSTALMRCCKDLGIASELWTKKWCEAFKKRFCVQVTRRNGKAWRRIDAEPFFDEVGKPPVKKTEPKTDPEENSSHYDRGPYPKTEEKKSFEEAVREMRADAAAKDGDETPESATEAFLDACEAHKVRLGAKRFDNALAVFQARATSEILSVSERTRFIGYLSRLG